MVAGSFVNKFRSSPRCKMAGCYLFLSKILHIIFFLEKGQEKRVDRENLLDAWRVEIESSNQYVVDAIMVPMCYITALFLCQFSSIYFLYTT